MEFIKQFLCELCLFNSQDFHLGSAKYGLTSVIGAFGGALYETEQLVVKENVPMNQFDIQYISQIAFAAFIGLVVTFIGRKIMTAIWDHVIKPMWLFFINKLLKK